MIQTGLVRIHSENLIAASCGESDLSGLSIHHIFAKKKCRSKRKKGSGSNGRALVFGNLCLAPDETGSDALKSMTGVILAGGHSTRMGQNKALLKIGDTTLIKRVFTILEPLFKEVIVVTNNPGDFTDLPCRKISDSPLGVGVPSALYAALEASRTERICVVPCDAPFLSAGLLSLMGQIDADYDVLLPVSATGIKPLHAIYSRSCRTVLKQLFAQGSSDLGSFLGAVRCYYLSPAEYQDIADAELSFCGLDLPGEYAALITSYGAESGANDG